MSKILKECSHEVTVLTMIAYLGYGAYFGAQHAAKLVPKSYNKYRNTVVFEIMNSFSRTDTPGHFKEENLTDLLEVLDHHSQFNITNETANNVLTRLTEERGEVFTMFLLPPVSACINTSCRISGNNDSLTPNHSPVDVSVFDFDGPIPVSKINLKCRSCCTIYGYNKYGKKKTDGERFYDTERELVEVTDVVYVTTRMYSMYISFW